MQNEIDILKSEIKTLKEELAKTKKKAQKYKENYYLIFDALPYGGEIFNNKGIIVSVSKGTTEMLGYKKSEMIGRHVTDFICKKSLPIFKSKLPEILSGKFTHADILIRHKDGHFLNIHRAARPIFNKNGEVKHILALNIDITDRVKSQKAIEEKNRELEIATKKAEESDRLKSAFLANMSHEIRTPMNSILGFAGLLKNNDIEEENRNEFLEIIEDSGKQLLVIISDILDISKIEANLIDLNIEKVNIKKLTDKINNTHTEQVKEKPNLDFIFIENDKNIEIETDLVRINQILSNLIGNAIKYTEKGSVSFSYTINNKDVIFSIKDTGFGISKENQKIIFDRFIRANNSKTKKFRGTGLGLSVSQGFAELLGGKIWVESELNIGSTFYFSHPIKQSSK